MATSSIESLMDFNGEDEQPKTEDKTFWKRRIPLFYLIVGIMLLFCMLTIIFWSVNAKSYSNSVDLYVLTYRNESERSSTTTTVKSTTEKKSTTTITPATTTTEKPRDFCAEVPDDEKFDCTPDVPLDENKCSERGCCYKLSKQIILSNISNLILGVPSCFYPSNYLSYKVFRKTVTDDGFTAFLERSTHSGFPRDIQILLLKVTSINEYTVRIKLTDSTNPRYEAPIREFATKKVKKEQQIYDVNLSDGGLLTVSRKLSGTNIFSTKLSQLVYSDQFIQLSTRLPSKYVYGLGEHYGPLLKSVNWTRYTFFNKDNFPAPEINLYGAHAFYLNIENDASNNGVFLLNSNSMDVILQPTPALTYRTIGGILDFFFFLGPTSTDVIRQYTELIGRTHIPPYWSFGFHLCRYGVFTANETRRIWKRNVDAGIPFDVQWNDIDYMESYNDFTYDKKNFSELPDFVKELHDMGMHYVVMFDPGVNNTGKLGIYAPYDDGLEQDVFIKNSTGDLFIGRVWNPVSTLFPDHTHPNGTKYWFQQFQKFHDQIDFDGTWIDMNEISNIFSNGSLWGCPEESSYENPPYVPGAIEPLYSKTVCMTAKHYKTLHYNEHNVYGFREAISTNLATKTVTGKRPFVISRSTFPGQGFFTGHWSGDIASTWEDMRYSVINTMEFNIFGIPMVGSDICGFRLSTTEELCARWFALGAFYPFARDHNDIDRVDQDPAGMGKRVFDSAMNSLTLRYKLLPYLYTLFFRSHIAGDTVVRPLLFEFQDDTKTYAIDEQFMWGSGIMIMPVLYPNVTEINAYFPAGRWYDLHIGVVKVVTTGTYYTLPAKNDTISAFIQGGNVIPFQYSNQTTTQSRNNSFYLVAGLNNEGKAFGELFWDDGDSLDPYDNQIYNHIQFYTQPNLFSSLVMQANYDVPMNLDNIKICTITTGLPTTVTLNNQNVTHSMENGCLIIDTENQPLLVPFIVIWK